MATPARKTTPPPAKAERVSDLYPFGTKWNAETGEHEEVQVELFEPEEGQIMMLLRMETWAANAAQEEDRELAGRANLDMMNVFLDILEGLFVDRRDMVAATRACASGDAEAYRRYTGLIGPVLKTFRDRHGEIEQPANRAGRRAAARRA